MKTLIDLTQIPKQKTGVGVYAVNLVKEIASLEDCNKYYVVVQDDDSDFIECKAPNITVIPIRSRIFRKLAFRFLFEQVLLPIITVQKEIDVLHSLHYSFPLVKLFSKKVVTVHDLTFFKFPQYHTFIKRNYFKFFILVAHLFVNRTIVISESTKQDLLKYTYTKSSRIEVVHLGCRPPATNIQEDDISTVRHKYGLPGNYLLYLGVIEPRKNLHRLIQAYNMALKVKHKYSLVIAGQKGWHYQSLFDLIKASVLESKIIFTGYVAEQDKYAMIKGSRVFVYPSVYEGFGLPVLEAMALGVPTIASKGSSLGEIAKGGGILVNTESVNAIATAIELLTEDPVLHNRMSRQAMAVSRQFSWADNAKDTVRAYRNLLYQNT